MTTAFTTPRRRAPGGLTVVGRFHQQVDGEPDAIAILSGGVEVTYGDLDRRANSLANYLRSAGVGRDMPVALCLERSAEAIVAILGILKAGAVYVPLEPVYPQARLATTLRTSEAALVLTTSSLSERLLGGIGRVLLLDAEHARIQAASTARPDVAPSPADRAYVMFTSGSTGEPKGVEITHRAIERLVCDVEYVQLGPGQTVLHAAPLAFDASTFEIWGPLLTGGRCAIYTERVPTAAGLARAIAEHGVTTAWLTAGLFNAVIDEAPESLSSLTQLLTGGEVLSVSHVRRALELLPNTQIINAYGPTETTTFATSYPIPKSLRSGTTAIPIGWPIRETTIYILDDAGKAVPAGRVGELYIGGSGLARGYLGRPDLTAERFVADPFTGHAGDRMYRTGDLARYLADGAIDYVGRVDDQIKISGYRIEPAEIETALARHPAVRQCVVTARIRHQDATKELVAHVVGNASTDLPSSAALREHLGRLLPHYMVPAAFAWVPSLPLTANGKVDLRALPEPIAGETGVLAHPSDGARSATERAIADVWGALLGVPRVALTENVFDLGVNSLLVVRAAARLRSQHGLDVPVARFFQHPTVRELAASLEARDEPRSTARLARESDGAAEAAHPREGIAIIGMAARFPGAATVDEFWRNLADGMDCITRFEDAELDATIDRAVRSDPAYVPARGILREVDKFDAAFFNLSPREAQLMDPQQRVFLELAWEALEHAACVPGPDSGPIGIFAGVYYNTYVTTVLKHRPDVVDQFGPFNVALLNEKDYVATRAAHALGLTGPALSIHTACSTSLVAICQAVQSLRSLQCDVALAGGVSLTLPTYSGYMHQDGSMLSPDGHTRPFDARAGGTVFSDGAGIVVLKRLRDAVRDRDTIYATIRGIGLNNDGAHKASFTAPSVDGQAAVIAMAQRDAGVSPRAISYVEAHGTATPLGDPIEIAGLTQVFRADTTDVGFCSLGSVKSNIGHTVMAAGAAGLIKTALALVHETIPPTVHFTAPNPEIDLARSPFVVSAKPVPWPRGGETRLAGVSSFGVGGTNAHVVLEEAPVAAAPGGARPTQLLVLSARSDAALAAVSNNLAQHLRANPTLRLAEIARTLQVGRRAFAHRRALTAASVNEAIDKLEGSGQGAATGRAAPEQVRPVFMFPGQGAQYPGMAAAIYGRECVFREAFDRCADVATSVLGIDLRDVLWGDGPDAAAVLRNTSFTQPALFAVEFALAELWRSWGVTPSLMIGHSVGEFVCATLAKVFSPEDGMRLVCERGRLMQALPGGSMLSVRLPAATLAERLGPSLAIASDNAPSLSVASGPTDAIEALQRILDSEGVPCRPLHTSHAFHSPMMDSVVEPFAAIVRDVALAEPSLPFISSVTGSLIAAEQALDPMYWARHLRQTVRFAEGVRTVCDKSGAPLLEVGPRGTLSMLARQQTTGRSSQPCVVSLGDSGDPEAEPAALLLALGQLWTYGVMPNWDAVAGADSGRRIALPTYPFERQRHWVDPLESVARPTATVSEIAQATPTTSEMPSSIMSQTAPSTSVDRRPRLANEIREILEQVSGIDVASEDTGHSFVELGFDSLVLTQVALALSKAFGLKIAFRQLLEEFTTVDLIADNLDRILPADPAAQQPAAISPTHPAPVATIPTPSPATIANAPSIVTSAAGGPSASSVQQLVEHQLRVMAQQLALLSGASITSFEAIPAGPAAIPGSGAAEATPAAPSAPGSSADSSKGVTSASDRAAANGKEPEAEALLTTGPTREVYDAKKAFGAAPRISLIRADDLTPTQRARLDAFVRRYTARTKESKRHTQRNRSRVADPRVATGFRPGIKELVYPLVMPRSAGSHMWDLDGNEYVDVLSGFGSNLFGWSPQFVIDAVRAQLDSGYAIGPQHPLTGEVAELFCEMTNTERAAFCNTGSEAVLGAIRIARTVTGRRTVAIFTGAYHGINDEVIVRGTKKGRSVPAAPGIMPSTAENVLVLDYGTDESLAILRDRADDLAAVVVEPVQSRRPDFQPREFLRELRAITERSGTVYIWDEIVTGFRCAPGGAQEIFGVSADIATYGKVVGGGLPIGVIAGRRQFMDALDGGAWQYGDDSVPEVGVTYFAGTFVRHPLALAAAKAVLLHLKAAGPELQRGIADRAERLTQTLNQSFTAAGAPLEIRRFASIWKPFYTGDHPQGDLLFYMLRDAGVHIYDGFPCFMTTAHTEADMAHVATAFKTAVTEMQEGGFLPAAQPRGELHVLDASSPPAPGARLGRDRDGSAAWFVPSMDEPGRFVKIDAA